MSRSKRNKRNTRREPTFQRQVRFSSFLDNLRLVARPSYQQIWQQHAPVYTVRKTLKRLGPVSKKQNLKSSFPRTYGAISSIDANQSVRSLLTPCQKRYERKQIMFASRKAGKSGQKTPNWTALSRKRCK